MTSRKGQCYQKTRFHRHADERFARSDSPSGTFDRLAKPADFEILNAQEGWSYHCWWERRQLRGNLFASHGHRESNATGGLVMARRFEEFQRHQPLHSLQKRRAGNCRVSINDAI